MSRSSQATCKVQVICHNLSAATGRRVEHTRWGANAYAARYPGPGPALRQPPARPPARRARPGGRAAGGCSSARTETAHGCNRVKPGWTRVNLNYFISGATAGYIAAAVELSAADGYRLLPAYRFDPRTGLWRHAAGPPRPQITLSGVRYGPGGEMD